MEESRKEGADCGAGLSRKLSRQRGQTLPARDRVHAQTQSESCRPTDVNLTPGRALVPESCDHGRRDREIKHLARPGNDRPYVERIYKPRTPTDVDDLTSHRSCYTGGVNPWTVSDEVINKVNELPRLSLARWRNPKATVCMLCSFHH